MRSSAYISAATLVSLTVTLLLGLCALTFGAAPQQAYRGTVSSLVPSPVSTLEWGGKIEGVYGQGMASDGIKGLEFAFDARSPNQVTQQMRPFLGNRLVGRYMPTSPVTVTGGLTSTWTMALDDSDVPNRFTVTASCPVSFTGIYEDFLDFEGTLTGVDCGQIGAHQPCRWQVQAERVGGQVCP